MDISKIESIYTSIYMRSEKKNMKFLKAYDEFSDAIYRHCYFRISNHEQALDLMQETFIRAWKYTSKGNEIKNIKPFLYRTANNLVIDYYRKKKEVSLDNMLDLGMEPAVSDEKNKIYSTAESKNISKLLDQLDEKHREVIVLKFIDDLSPKDIAKLTGETDNVISVRIHRGIKKLKELIGNG